MIYKRVIKTYARFFFLKHQSRGSYKTNISYSRLYYVERIKRIVTNSCFRYSILSVSFTMTINNEPYS